jgi:DNA-binding NtrC family response regulator
MPGIARSSDIPDDGRDDLDSIRDRAMIEEALRRANGSKSEAARSLGWTRNQLRYRLKNGV